MPISTTTGAVTAGRALNSPDGQTSGVIYAGDFAVCDNNDRTKQLRIDSSVVPTNTAITIAAPSTSGVMGVSGFSVIQYSAPTTGQSITVDAATRTMIFNPLGTLAALTVKFPIASDGKMFTISCSQIVTTLTLSPAGSDTIANTLTAFTAGQSVTFVARSAVWYRG